MEKPILFNTEMVQAILEGRKTNTRRVVKPQNSICNGYSCTGFIFDTTVNNKENDCIRFDHEKYLPIFLRPPYAVGDTLWVRETWCQLWDLDEDDQIIEGTEHYYYKANNTLPPYTHILKSDGTHTEDWIWSPSIHMPRAAARLFLKVTNVRCERLQDITEDGAEKEGAPHDVIDGWDIMTVKQSFAHLWQGIYGTWNENPWVWVIEFERMV